MEGEGPRKISLKTEREEEGKEEAMTKSQSYLDFLASLTGASISRDSIEIRDQPSTPKGQHRSLGSAPSIHLPHMQYVNHFAVDIGRDDVAIGAIQGSACWSAPVRTILGSPVR